MLHLYHEFIRSIPLRDLELYIYCLPRITNFTFNHPNYARWLVRYHDNLLKLSETHKDVYDEFKKGCFGIKRTKKDFSRLPIDLTLEQTVTADAEAKRLEFQILQIQYLQDSDGLIVILSEWSSFRSNGYHYCSTSFS